MSAIVELDITTLSHAAEGLGREAGRAVFVPFALPGERVQAEITEEKKNYARARLLAVPTPAPDRVSPRCPHHFACPPASGASEPAPRACGGCHLQHLAYSAQLAFKQQVVIEQFTKIGKLARPPVRPTWPAPAPFNYRNQAQFALTPAGQLGFRAAGSHALVPVRECHLLTPPLAAVWQCLRIETASAIDRLTLRAGADADVLVVFEMAESAPELEVDLPVSVAVLRPDGTTLTLAGSDYVTEVVRGRAFKVSAGSFFQVNPALTEHLVALVMDALALTGSETVLDLYCGVGLFSAFIAPQCQHLTGIEAWGPAVDDAVINLDEFNNVEIYAAPAEEVLPALEQRFAAGVLDPPRAGCAPAVLEALVARPVERLVYVACDPATQARDVRRLLAGGYQLEWVQPLDMFPQTHHVESLACLRHTG